MINSYTGSSKEENIGSKVVTAGVGGGTGAIISRKAAKEAVESAATRTAKATAQKAISKTVASGILKGATKAIGWVGLVPDAITFAKGFYKGYSSYGE